MWMWKRAVTTLTVWCRPFGNIFVEPMQKSKSGAMPDEFATAMQQLSAEAQKTLTLAGNEERPGDSTAFSKVAWEVRGLSNRLENLEHAITKKIENVAAGPTNASELAPHLQKIDEQLAAIRSTESVNHKLFDTLHAEL